LDENLESFSELLTRVISQTERCVLQGEKVPDIEKLVSIFESHTEISRRGKSGTDLASKSGTHGGT
jgi:hypothetical protein